MLFLVDGYNVTKGDPATRALSLEAQRDALVSRLRSRGTELLGRGRIVVFFDGEAGMVHQAEPGRDESYPVEVVYSRGSSADDSIVVRAGRGAGIATCVVTSDNGLAERVRSIARASVEIRPRETLYDAAHPRRHRSARAGVAREAGLPPGANAITKELKDLWLDGEE